MGLPLAKVPQIAVDELASLCPARPTAVVCAGGYRSSAACGLLFRHGFADLRNVVGGTSAWVGAGTPDRSRPPVTDRIRPLTGAAGTP